MYPSLQSKVWYTIGTVEILLPIVLDIFISHALANQLGSKHAEIVADTAVTLASANTETVAGFIVSRLRKYIFIFIYLCIHLFIYLFNFIKIKGFNENI